MSDVKEKIFELMMADFDEHGIAKITREAIGGIVDSLVELAKARNRIKGLEADINILTKDVSYHNCNTCALACEHRPMPGERTRSNCFKWEGCSNTVARTENTWDADTSNPIA